MVVHELHSKAARDCSDAGNGSHVHLPVIVFKRLVGQTPFMSWESAFTYHHLIKKENFITIFLQHMQLLYGVPHLLHLFGLSININELSGPQHLLLDIGLVVSFSEHVYAPLFVGKLSAKVNSSEAQTIANLGSQGLGAGDVAALLCRNLLLLPVELLLRVHQVAMPFAA